jgi:hypothetical protein
VGEGAPAEPGDPVPPAEATGPAKPPVEKPAPPTETAPASRPSPNQVGTKNCFVAGTPVLTPTGETTVDQLRAGDFVLARSELDPTGPVEAKEVEAVFVRSAPVIRFRVSGQEIESTREHLVHVEGSGWQCVGDLRLGDRLSSHNGLAGVVEAVGDQSRVETVYNIRVADHHTYFVGALAWGFSVWVHNDYTAAEIPAEEGGGWGVKNSDGQWIKPDGSPAENPGERLRLPDAMEAELEIAYNETTWRANAARTAEAARPQPPEEPPPTEPEPELPPVVEAPLEEFPTFSDAVGVDEPCTNMEMIGATNNPDILAQGFTQRWVGLGPDGVWYSASYCPSRGTWAFGHVSSRNG